VDIGDFSPVQLNKGYFCEYWINPRFQTCLKLENSVSKNIFLIGGRYYERGEGASSALCVLECRLRSHLLGVVRVFSHLFMLHEVVALLMHPASRSRAVIL